MCLQAYLHEFFDIDVMMCISRCNTRAVLFRFVYNINMQMHA